MIAKHVPMRASIKSSLPRLIKYISDEQGKSQRVGDVLITNCQNNTIDWALSEIQATQALNTRAQSDKTYHLLISFPAGEHPSEDVLRSIENRLCDALGFSGHQRISGVHHDTDNLHIHVAINKIHPTRHTLHDPYQDYKILANTCSILEHEFGLEKTNHQALKTGAQNRAADMEHAAGMESLLGWIKRECLTDIQNATSWNELHQVLQKNGLQLHQRGNGFIFTDGQGVSVKASSVARNLSKPALEKKFGPYKEDSDREKVTPGKQYTAGPYGGRGSNELYVRYQQEYNARAEQRSRLLRELRYAKDRRIEAVKRKGRLKRAAIKLMGGSRFSKQILYRLTSQSLQDDIKSINADIRRERQQISENYQNRRWLDWLQHAAKNGDAEALAALRRKVSVSSRSGVAASDMPVDNITKRGTVIYAGKTTIRDDGTRLQISGKGSSADLQKALQMAITKYGHRIKVEGSTAFKERIVNAAVLANLPITFSDAALERRRQELTQEQINERDRKRRSGRSAGDVGTNRPDTRNGRRHAATGQSVSGASKSNVSSVGRNPPPASQNRLRGLHQLGMVQFTNRGEMLLPGDVPGDVEQPGAKRDNKLRRNISGAGGIVAGQSAAEKYISERNAKRQAGINVLQHCLYQSTANTGSMVFSGVRHINGHHLALLQLDRTVHVLPISEANAQRLKRYALGTAVSVTPKGSVVKHGRSNKR